MKKAILLSLYLLYSFQISAQDTSLIGRFSAGISGLYSKSNLAYEKANGGFGLQFRYFPNMKNAFVISYQNVHSSVIRFEKLSQAFNSSLAFGFEKHVPISNFSPYLALEVGLNITKVKSDLIQLPSNNQFFQNDLPNYLFKPKLGCGYRINDNIFLNVEGAFNWVISADRDNSNPLFDDSYTAIYFGRKVPTVSLGLHYLFNE
jgi:hypothetical protein